MILFRDEEFDNHLAVALSRIEALSSANIEVELRNENVYVTDYDEDIICNALDMLEIRASLTDIDYKITNYCILPLADINYRELERIMEIDSSLINTYDFKIVSLNENIKTRSIKYSKVSKKGACELIECSSIDIANHIIRLLSKNRISSSVYKLKNKYYLNAVNLTTHDLLRIKFYIKQYKANLIERHKKPYILSQATKISKSF